jgi:hypothetical protein
MKMKLAFSKNNWLLLAFHPITLSLILSLISAFFIFPKFEEYKIELLEKTPHNSFTKIYMNDLDQDGVSEYITLSDAENSAPAFMRISSQLGVGNMHQINFRGKWLNFMSLNFGDFDQNQHNEIYAINRVEDSLFLNIDEVLVKGGFVRKDIFLDKVGKFNKKGFDVQLVGLKLQDVNGDGFKDLLFVLHAGYSKYPRRFYFYDIHNNLLQMSPLSGVGPKYNLSFKDINGDGFPEVLGSLSAPYNFHSPIPYPDSSAWLMVYTRGAQFLFPPVEFKYKQATLRSVFANYKGKNYICCLLQKPVDKQGEIIFTALLFDVEGKLIKQKDLKLEGKKSTINFIYQKNFDGMPMIYNSRGNLYRLDFDLNLKPIRKLDLNSAQRLGNNVHVSLDLDHNGKEEYFMITSSGERYILSDDLKHLTSYGGDHINLMTGLDFGFSAGQSSFGINTKLSFLEYKYSKNPYSWLRFPLLIFIFLLSYFFFYFLNKIQKKQLEKRYEAEKKIHKYQYQGIRNQLDPHFALNILNAIQSLFYQKDFDRAKRLLSKYGQLNRYALRNAEKIAVSLEDELDFVENFLALEKFRFEDRFDYFIKVDKRIDAELIELPRMLIHTFAENAIKHGLFPKGEGGKLKIEIEEKEKFILVNIEDNGIGRAKSKKLKTTNHGRGLLIVKEIVQLYNKFQRADVSYRIIDLFEVEKAVGTRVEIRIPNR